MRGKGALRVTFGSTNNSSNRPADQRTSVAPNHPADVPSKNSKKEKSCPWKQAPMPSRPADQKIRRSKATRRSNQASHPKNKRANRRPTKERKESNANGHQERRSNQSNHPKNKRAAGGTSRSVATRPPSTNQPSKPTIRSSGHIHSCQPAEASDNRSKWPRNKVPRHQSGKINPFTIPSNFKGWQSIPIQPSNRNNSNIPTIEQVYKTSERPICSNKFAQKCLQRCS